MLCTEARAKKIVVGLTAVALTAEGVNVASLHLALLHHHYYYYYY